MPTSAEREPETKTKHLDSQAPRYLPLETVAVRFRGEGLGSGEPVLGVLANISASGCCVITNLPIPVDASAVLELEAVRCPEATEVPCTVIWCEERMEPVKEIVGYLTGLRFDEGSGEAAAALIGSGIFQLVP